MAISRNNDREHKKMEQGRPSHTKLGDRNVALMASTDVALFLLYS